MSDAAKRLKPGLRVWRCSINYKRQKKRERVTVTTVKDGYAWTEDGLRYSLSDLKLNMPGESFLAAGFYSVYWLEVG